MAPRPAARLNEVQSRIRALLAATPKPLSAYDVIDALRGEARLAPPTVYRALQKLIDVGLVHRLETQNAYVACRHAEDACGHSHRAGFMICRLCGETQEFGDAEIEALLAKTAARSGFAAERVSVEIQGRCADCRALTPPDVSAE